MEPLKHECGVAMIRLLKPLSYYQEKYGTWMYGLNKLYLLMEKQHNRGQEGAGLACVKMQSQPGEEYMFRERALGTGAITEIFEAVHRDIAASTPDKDQLSDADYAQRYTPFAGELYMGHLRYSTTGKSGLSYVHPVLRRDNWRVKNLCLCGNFNLTNVDEIFDEITGQGQHPRQYADTYIMLEQMGHRLDREADKMHDLLKAEGLQGTELTRAIEDRIDVANVLRRTSPAWDGGYVICGVTGSGEMFSIRDPWGLSYRRLSICRSIPFENCNRVKPYSSTNTENTVPKQSILPARKKPVRSNAFISLGVPTKTYIKNANN